MTKNRFTFKTNFLIKPSKFFEIQFLSSAEIAGAVFLKCFLSIKPQNNGLSHA